MTDFTRNNEIVVCDAMAYLSGFGDGSVDAVICDPPYLTTYLAFDKAKIDWGALIAECLRVVKPSGAVVMFAAMRTAVAMIGAAPKYYRYDMVWHKTMVTGFPSAALQPLRAHEHILVWSTGATISGAQLKHNEPMAYFPVMGQGAALSSKINKKPTAHYHGGVSKDGTRKIGAEERYPQSVFSFDNELRGDSQHPTQKPLDLMAYLVRTYTRPDELVIDCFAGSGSTLVAARNTGRRYAGCDLDAGYVAIAAKRLAEPYTPDLFPEAAPVEPEATQGDMFAAWDSA